MGILRILILAALVWLAWRLIRNLLPGPSNASDEPSTDQDNPEKMVKCSHCGVHLPEKQAIKQGDHYFCGSAHLIEFQEKNNND